MNIVQIWGGLGNQMFQYAFARGLAYKTGEPFCVDLGFFDNQHPSHRCCLRTYELERIFGLKLPVVEKNIIHRLKKKAPFNWHIGRNLKIQAINPWRRDRDEKFHPEVWRPIWPKGTDIYYKGYWQHEEYFDFISDEIRNDFTFKSLSSPYSLEVLHQIKASESMSLHFRRTDFVGSGSETSVEYYQNAVEIIVSVLEERKTQGDKKIGEAKLFLFSDDIEWVKRNANFNLPVVYVDQTNEQGDDMFLMSQCKHNVIAPHSSFSRWGTWLNSNPQKIIV